MPESYLRQPECTYSACGPFIKYRERIHKFRETDNFKHLYRNEVDKVDFTSDAAYLIVKI